MMNLSALDGLRSHALRPVTRTLRLVIILAAAALMSPEAVRAQETAAAGGYGDTLYPYVHEYDQVLVYKIAVDYCPANPMPPLNAAQTLDVIRRIDNLTRGIPKIAYLVGWQYRGHDTGYPALDKVNQRLKRPEDADALDSLRWLMREGPKYHTLVSLHVNFSDCYLDDNALGPYYKERDIIVRNGDGTHRQGYAWCDHMAYRARIRLKRSRSARCSPCSRSWRPPARFTRTPGTASMTRTTESPMPWTVRRCAR